MMRVGQLGQFLVDDVGEFSCMRLMCLLVDVTVLGTWAWANIRSGQYIPMGYAEAGLIGAAHGWKSLQTRFELGSNGGYGGPGRPGGQGEI
jgi:hypothetical protein